MTTPKDRDALIEVMCLLCGDTVPVEVGPGEGVPYDFASDGRTKIPVRDCASPDHCPMTDKVSDTNVVFWQHKRRCRFKNCPIGLFKYGDTIAMMTEYATERRVDGQVFGVNRDAYIVSSGEYFWGGVSTGAERDELMVTPLTLGEPE